MALILGYLTSYLGNPWRTLLVMTILILLLLIIYFFRYPRRTLTDYDPNQIWAPADGKVVVVEEVYEPTFLKQKCLQISIFMSPLNVHVNWIPTGGKILKKDHSPGKYLVAWHPKSSTDNERTTILLDCGTHKVLVSQIAGAMARRIINYMKPGDVATTGDEMGFIRFGSRVDVLLPRDATVCVEVGQKVTGIQTLLATLS